MRLLLDPHAFLWYVLDDPSLSATARGAISDPANRIWVSPASHWEIAIKVSLGKYALAGPFESFWHAGIYGNGFEVLPVEPRHTAAVAALPFHHRDPFDRLIVCQAAVEGVPVVSADTTLDAYGVRRIR